jgi:hypothetical protein
MNTTRQTLTGTRLALVQFRAGARAALLAAQATAAANNHHEVAATNTDDRDCSEGGRRQVRVEVTCTCGLWAQGTAAWSEDFAATRSGTRQAHREALARLDVRHTL